VDLDATTFGAVTRYRKYSEWLDELTPRQREFVEAPPNSSIKLRGPAGSGKTLALELKALRELYRARQSNEGIRILFATHSWSVAAQVDAGLRELDESGDISPIEVYPLVSIAQELLPSERSGHGFDLLGEDSLTGKTLQIELIADILDRATKGDWLAYRSRTSPEFRRRVESEPKSRERNALVWDLMIEFACVLSAHGILPGVNAPRLYAALHRTPWMMPLANKADKDFVLHVYSEYVGSLRRDHMLTSDQLVNDFLNYLETFTWNIRRERDGYNLIFVDELHLFNEQERLVLHYLTRSPEEYPKMFMALDPRQSPAEVYVEVAPGSITRGESGMADLFLGSIKSMELSTVHRFTPEILRLVRHINNVYPALGLGEEWQLDLSAAESTVSSGETPLLIRHHTKADEVDDVLRRTTGLVESRPNQERSALILIEPMALPAYTSEAKRIRAGRISIIQSRDDVASLQYTRRSLVISAAEFVGGLQFDNVVIAGVPNTREGVANLGHQRRRFLSLLYLAVSRASRHVEIHVNDEEGGIPQILESALEGGVVVLGG
jgi:hypothetical protein